MRRAYAPRTPPLRPALRSCAAELAQARIAAARAAVAAPGATIGEAATAATVERGWRQHAASAGTPLIGVARR
jgi:hypothetical protein